LTDRLVEFVQLNRRQRVELRNRVERLGELFDWSALIVNYNEAHDLALKRLAQGHPGKVEVKVV
jgi:glycogen(starch) synthase